MSALVAIVSLLLLVASIPVVGLGVLLAPFLLGLFVLALVGVFGTLEDRTVRRRDVVLDPRRWRNGS